MGNLLKWLSAIGGFIASIFAVRKHIERAAVARDRRQLEKAVKAVEKQLARKDAEIDSQAAEKIKTIQQAAEKALAKPTKTGADANALIASIGDE